MSEQDFNKIFSQNLRRFMDRDGITQSELSKRLGVGHTTIYNWLYAIKTPRMSKVDALCSIFGCKRSDLIAQRDEAPAQESLCQFFEQCHGSDFDIVQALLKLDHEDRLIISGEIRAMLRADKYVKREELA